MTRTEKWVVGHIFIWFGHQSTTSCSKSKIERTYSLPNDCHLNCTQLCAVKLFLCFGHHSNGGVFDVLRWKLLLTASFRQTSDVRAFGFQFSSGLTWEFLTVTFYETDWVLWRSCLGEYRIELALYDGN